jgi:hypothetical protein
MSSILDRYTKKYFEEKVATDFLLQKSLGQPDFTISSFEDLNYEKGFWHLSDGVLVLGIVNEKISLSYPLFLADETIQGINACAQLPKREFSWLKSK